jgi:hypothetical protein
MDNRSQFGFGEVGDSRLQPFNIFLHVPDGDVAHMTEQATDPVGGVAVIDMKSAASTTTWLFADCTYATLRGEQIVPIVQRHPVLKFDIATSCVVLLQLFRIRLMGVFWNNNAWNDLMIVSAGRTFIATRLMGHQGIVAVLYTTVRAWAKHPTGWTNFLKTEISMAFGGMFLAPIVKALKIAFLACGVKAARFVDGFRELGHREKPLTPRANFVFGGFLGALSAFLPGMTKIAFGRYRLSAPFAFNNSLYLTCVFGHVYSSLIASLEYLITSPAYTNGDLKSMTESGLFS